MSPLEGFETGYEERFDFPYRAEPPRQLYMIATLPRTGSSYFSHLLWQSGCLGAPLEYLNFLPEGPARLAVSDPQQQLSVWRSLLHLRTSPNGVFGVKCFSLQLRELQQRNPVLLREVFSTLLMRGPATRVIKLRRRDRVAHAISYARSALSGIWRREQEVAGGAAVVDYSPEAVEQALAYIDQQEADWDMLFRELRVEPLTLWYEDVLADPAAAVGQAAQFLGVDIEPAAAITIPMVEKQAQDDSQRWRERYEGASAS